MSPQSPRLAAMALALVCLATRSAAAQEVPTPPPPAPSTAPTPPDVIVLRDGERVEGTVVAVHVGVDVTVRLPQGTPRVVQWSEVQNAPGVAEGYGSTPGGVHVSVGVGPEPPRELDARAEFLTPHAGAEPVLVESDGVPLMISEITGEERITVPLRRSIGYPMYGTVMQQQTAYLCTTPCTLYLAPGGRSFHVGGGTQLATDVTFDAVPGGRRVMLHSTNQMRPAWGVLSTAMGGMFTLGGSVAMVMGASWGPPTTGSRSADGVFMGVGGVMLGIGLPLLVLGIQTLATSRTGIAGEGPLEGGMVGRVQPLARREAGVRVRLQGASVGPGMDGTGIGGSVVGVF